MRQNFIIHYSLFLPSSVSTPTKSEFYLGVKLFSPLSLSELKTHALKFTRVSNASKTRISTTHPGKRPLLLKRGAYPTFYNYHADVIGTSFFSLEGHGKHFLYNVAKVLFLRNLSVFGYFNMEKRK